MFLMPSGILTELLATGEYEIEKGRFVRFDQYDLGRMAVAFNELQPKRRAPVVIGHPENDNDAEAFVEDLHVLNGALYGYLKDFASESFVAGLNDKTYMRYQAQFWGPEHPDNPKPGSWMLKHVGVLGPPVAAVRGPLVSEASFMESLGGAGRKLAPELRFGTGGCIEFSEFPVTPSLGVDMARRARALMDFLAERGEEISASQAVAFVTAIDRSHGLGLSISEVRGLSTLREPLHR
jgi:hypothetical protein